MKTKELERTFEKIKAAVSNNVRKKMESVKIDFDKDNYLPELNKEDAQKIGVPSNKKVVFKAQTIKRNLEQHSEVNKEEYNEILGETLYLSDLILPNKKGANPNYYHFIKYKQKDNTLVLLDCEEKKENLEIVHLHKIRQKDFLKLLERLKG